MAKADKLNVGRLAGVLPSPVVECVQVNLRAAFVSKLRKDSLHKNLLMLRMHRRRPSSRCGSRVLEAHDLCRTAITNK